MTVDIRDFDLYQRITYIQYTDGGGGGFKSRQDIQKKKSTRDKNRHSIGSSQRGPLRRREAPGAEQDALDAPDALLDSLDLVVGLGKGAVVDGPRGPRGHGRPELVDVGGQVAENDAGRLVRLGRRGVRDRHLAHRRRQLGEPRRLRLDGRGLLCTGGGGEGRLRRRGLHSYVAVEELRRVAAVTASCVVVVLLPCRAAGLVLRAGGRQGWDFGHDALKLLNGAAQAVRGGAVQVDPGVGQGLDHRGKNILGRADYEGSQAGKGRGRVEEGGGGYERGWPGGFGEELGVGYYRRLVGLLGWLCLLLGLLLLLHLWLRWQLWLRCGGFLLCRVLQVPKPF